MKLIHTYKIYMKYFSVWCIYSEVEVKVMYDPLQCCIYTTNEFYIWPICIYNKWLCVQSCKISFYLWLCTYISPLDTLVWLFRCQSHCWPHSKNYHCLPWLGSGQQDRKFHYDMSARYAVPCHYQWSPPGASWCGSHSEGCPLPHSTDVHSHLDSPSQTLAHPLWLQHLNRTTIYRLLFRLHNSEIYDTMRETQSVF